MNQGPESLAGAIALAADVHRDQVDKGGEPYILHPLRVMEDAMAHCGDLWVVGIIAVLHDVLEDNTTYSDAQLRGRIETEFGQEVLMCVSVLTKPKGYDYFHYIEDIKVFDNGHPQREHLWVTEVKLADLRDNMRIVRQPTLSDKDMLRIQKYHMAYRMLDERYG